MKISVLNIGRTHEKYLQDGIAIYERRLRHYVAIDMICMNEYRGGKNIAESLQKDNEGKIILNALSQIDYPVLLDEKGKQFDSPGFANFIQQAMNRSTRNLGFVIGGPYGFSDEVYRSVPTRISVSSMTFSHQLIRIVFMEQLYRAFTIIRGEPYHHI
ncbi:MAG TPA: 23S rRNA (pseudouridine(1915)-N(3))-methyltransferase RlmH [Bacteroidales bacterium]|nr:23S rRNA (pseudouridine(1915)-N(3))-methyltransferase RlmH [Bacteroidales bacterium]